MSKLIVEMEICKSCLDCDLHQIVYGDSYADTDVYCFKEKRLVGKRFGQIKDLARPTWCPICGVLPEQHGDLIDRDVLLKECYPDDEFDAHVIYVDDIQKAKAVIAAERSEDGTD